MSQSQTVEALIALTVSDALESEDPAQDNEVAASEELWAIETPEIEIKPDYTQLLSDCQTWFEQRQHQKIADTIEAIPEDKRTEELNCELGRAYNNLAHPGDKEAFQKALNCLKPLEQNLKEDFRWNYRIAYTYFHLEQEWLALQYFQQALQLRKHDQGTINFIHKCFSALGAPEFVHNFASRVDRMWEQFTLKESDWREELDQGKDLNAVFTKISEVVSQALENQRIDLSFDLSNEAEPRYILTFELCNTTTFVYILNYVIAMAPKILHRHWSFYVGHPKSEYISLSSTKCSIAPDKIYVKILDSKSMEKITLEQDAAAKMPSFQGENHDLRDDSIELEFSLVSSHAAETKAKTKATVKSKAKGKAKDKAQSAQCDANEPQDQVTYLTREELLELKLIKQDSKKISQLLMPGYTMSGEDEPMTTDEEDRARAIQLLSNKLNQELQDFSEQLQGFIENTDPNEPYVPQLITPPHRNKYSVCLYCEDMSRLLKENYRRSTPALREKIQNMVKRIMLITNQKVGECTAFTAFSSFRFTGEKRQFDEIPATAFTLAELDTKVQDLNFKLNMTSQELLKEYVLMVYNLRPNANPNEPKLRQEIFSGWSFMPQLCNEYSLDDTSLINLFHHHGITLGFVSYEFAPWNYADREITPRRSALQRKITSFIARNPMCMVIGAAYGLYHDYVDFICVGDIRAVQRELYGFCARENDTPMMIYSPFRYAPVTIIFDATAEAAKATKQQLAQAQLGQVKVDLEQADSEHSENKATEEEAGQAHAPTQAQAPVSAAPTATPAANTSPHDQAGLTVESSEHSQARTQQLMVSPDHNADSGEMSTNSASNLASDSTSKLRREDLPESTESLHDHEVNKATVRNEVQFHPSAELRSALKLFTLEEESKQEQEKAQSSQEQIEYGFPIISESPLDESDLSETERSETGRSEPAVSETGITKTASSETSMSKAAKRDKSKHAQAKMGHTKTNFSKVVSHHSENYLQDEALTEQEQSDSRNRDDQEPPSMVVEE